VPSKQTLILSRGGVRSCEGGGGAFFVLLLCSSLHSYLHLSLRVDPSLCLLGELGDRTP
jgi:hypothetical protein